LNNFPKKDVEGSFRSKIAFLLNATGCVAFGAAAAAAGAEEAAATPAPSPPTLYDCSPAPAEFKGMPTTNPRFFRVVFKKFCDVERWEMHG
jgi:hypothetical protein